MPGRTQGPLRSEAVQFRLRGRYPLRREVPCTSPTTQLCNSPIRRQTIKTALQPSYDNGCRLSHRKKFGLIPFRSPLLRESRFLSFPLGTKMFQFPSLPLRALCIQAGVHAALPAVGFPIRKSRGQRLVSTSPGLIAATHVLRRLLAPRHPPCALSLLIGRTHLLPLWSFQGARRNLRPT